MEPQTPAETEKTIGNLKEIVFQLRHSRWFFSALAALAAFFIIKQYMVDIRRVNNRDMKASFHYGDALVVLKAGSGYKRGDVVYLKMPGGKGLPPVYFFQRIIALPGDSLYISGSKVYVNGRPVDEPAGVKHNYFIKTRGDSSFRTRYALDEGSRVSSGFDYSYSLTEVQFNRLLGDSLVTNIEFKSEKPGVYDESCFPHSPAYPWNRHHYGRLRVPGKDQVLILDTINLALYSAMIADYEDNELERYRQDITINGKPGNTYLVKKNYYFVLGDNRDNANDSRIWGFLPESHIAGRAAAVLRRSRK